MPATTSSDTAVTPTATPTATSTVAADRLLSAMSSIRRANRRYQGRPVVLSSLTGSQLELLRLVRRRPGVSIAQAADELQLASNTVSTLVTQLCRRGVLVRQTDPTDRRVARLVVTREVSQQADAWRDRRVAAVADVLDGLSPEARECVERALPVLAQIGDRMHEGGSGA
jgi:DNA-binding MarR family transcriptional regulator